MDEKFIHVSVISPEKSYFDGEASSVMLPGNGGLFTILPGHVNIISALDPGMLTVKTKSGDTSLYIQGGFIEASQDSVNALIEGTINVAEIDVEEEKKELNALLSQIIPHEKRTSIENKLANHRLRITLSQKK
ncbi:MAG: ATP synthase F1 subunit epsilon [Spirochaetia bacterium]|nr:ATP synthase F1 subunit epsilon [Spirochaetia bacterium]